MSPATPSPMRTTQPGSGVDVQVCFFVGAVLVALVTTAVFIVVGASVGDVVSWVVTIAVRAAVGTAVGLSAINVTVFGPDVVTLTASW